MALLLTASQHFSFEKRFARVDSSRLAAAIGAHTGRKLAVPASYVAGLATGAVTGAKKASAKTAQLAKAKAARAKAARAKASGRAEKASAAAPKLAGGGGGGDVGGRPPKVKRRRTVALDDDSDPMTCHGLPSTLHSPSMTFHVQVALDDDSDDSDGVEEEAEHASGLQGAAAPLALPPARRSEPRSW